MKVPSRCWFTRERGTQNKLDMRTKTISPELLAQILSASWQKTFWSHVVIRGADDCWLWTACVSSRYGQVTLKRWGNKFTFRAHKIAWISSHRKTVAAGMCVLHSCINTPLCCNPKHLREGTQLENMQDMDRQGRRGIVVGEAARDAKLTNEQVIEIRFLYSLGVGTHRSLGKEFGVSGPTIRQIVIRNKWKHI